MFPGRQPRGCRVERQKHAHNILMENYLTEGRVGSLARVEVSPGRNTSPEPGAHERGYHRFWGIHVDIRVDMTQRVAQLV